MKNEINIIFFITNSNLYNTPNTNHIMALSLAGRRCVITGGASGLGKATAARFARNGAQVVILDLPSSDGTAVANELGDNVAVAMGQFTCYSTFVCIWCNEW